MKKMFLLTVVLTLMLSALPILASQVFTFDTPYSNEVFSAIFPTPTDPKLGVEHVSDKGTTSIDHATYTAETYSVTTLKGKAAFFVVYMDYSSPRGTDIQTLDTAINGGLASGGLTRVPDSGESTTLNGLFAREAEGVSDNFDAFLRVATASGNRTWLVLAVFDKTLHATHADADEFFNSVRRKGN